MTLYVKQLLLPYGGGTTWIHTKAQFHVTPNRSKCGMSEAGLFGSSFERTLDEICLYRMHRIKLEISGDVQYVCTLAHTPRNMRVFHGGSRCLHE